MRIEFRKISVQKMPFTLENDIFQCAGSFKKLSNSVVDLKFHLNAITELICDRCGQVYNDDIDEDFSFKVNDGYFEGNDLDVIECHDHFIDFDAIILGEIEAIKSDYHYCKNCKKIQGE